MNYLNTTEKKIAENLINAGLGKAARSFSSIAGQEVGIEVSTLEIAREWTGRATAKYKGELTLLTTEMIGELNGKSYLIFTREECDSLLRACFPKKEKVNYAVLEEAFLKELDNILSASVITEFSDFLQVEVYGDVPAFYRQEAGEIESLIRQDFARKNDDIFLMANAKFLFKDSVHLRPQFFWKLTEGFISLIRKVAANEAV